jgi:hypothetical protein
VAAPADLGPPVAAAAATGAVRDLDAAVSELRGRCEHVVVDERLPALGYRFFGFAGAELPPVFIRRFEAGDGAGAITLMAGVDPRSGEGVLDAASPSEAADRIAAGSAGVWTVRLTLGARMLSIDDLCALRHREPSVLTCFAAELRALGPGQRSACPLCRARAADAA